VLLIIAAPRVWQWYDWTSAPEAHFAGEVVVAGIDSYHFFRVARDMREGVWDTGELDTRRNFPDGASRERVSFFPRMVAVAADLGDTTVYRAGMLVSLVLGVLFAVPMLLYFVRCGMPLAGVVGAALGGVAPAYLQRSSVYRVDTDGGNLFCVWLVSYSLLVTLQSRGWRQQLASALVAGLVCRGFILWYAQPGFVWVFTGTLLLGLRALRVRPRVSAALLGLYALCAGTHSFALGAADLHAFVRGYLLGEVAEAGSVAARFPDVLDEILELARAPFPTSLAQLQEPWPLALLGLIGFLVMLVSLRARAVPLLPHLMFGALALVQSQRFLMYLAPLAAAGLGALLSFLLRGRVQSEWARCGAAFLLVAACLPGSAAFDAPRPRMGVEELAAFQELKAVAPPGAVAFAPWNEGYPLIDVAGLRTFGDGQAPDPVVEQLIALSLLSAETFALQAVPVYLASHSRAELHAALERGGSQGALVREIGAFAQPAPVPIVVVMTEKLMQGFSRIYKKAAWNFERQEGELAGYDFRVCMPLPERRYRCSKEDRRDLLVDPEAGTIGDAPSIRRFLRVRDGVVVEDRDFGRRGLVLQLLEAPEAPHSLHLLGDAVFRSNFNQMFVLGRYDANLFEPLSTSLPELRAYLLRSGIHE
jgi:dolichyl-diphosphooligosaccharide--protein glycosyltransferase